VRFQATRTLPWWMHWMPEPMGRGVCVALGRAGHALVRRDRLLARRNLARVYPDWDRETVEAQARRVFQEIGRSAYDFLRYPLLPPGERDRLVRIEGREILERAGRRGRGAVLVTAHLGCWELIGAALVREGFPVKALARPLREKRLDDLLRRHRSRMGVETLSSEGLPLAAARHLRGGGFLGVLADQRTKGEGVPVWFLGQPTRMTRGPARLALTTGASLIPLGIRRLSDGTHRIRVLPPVEEHAGRGDVSGLTQEVAYALERLIREAPTQWMWIHPRWEERAGKREAPGARPGSVLAVSTAERGSAG